MPTETEFDVTKGHLFWPSLAFGMLLIYWLTNSTITASLVPSLLSTLAMLRTAFWLRSCDEVTSRRRACFGFHLAAGCYQAAATAFVSGLLLFIWANWRGQVPNASRFLAYVGIIFISVGIASLIGLWAIATAWRGNNRVWVHPGTLRMCDGDYDELADLTFSRPRFNYGSFVIAISLQFPLLFLGTLILIGVTATGVEPSTTLVVVGGILMAIFFLVLPILMILVQAVVSARILATNPAECWQESELG